MAISTGCGRAAGWKSPETHRNIEVIWLLRHLKPDFQTIADFRRDNRNAFRPVFREFVLLCRQLDLFGRELLAVDGTRIKAVNNKNRNFTRATLTQLLKAADAKLEDYLQRLDKRMPMGGTGGSRVENLAEKITRYGIRREQHKDMLAALDRTGESQISLTDPDSRAMAAHTHVAVGYNVQVAVDAKHKLIVEQQVTNQVVDIWGYWHRPPNQPKRFSASSGSRSSPTGAISRSRTLRPARRPGSILTALHLMYLPIFHRFLNPAFSQLQCATIKSVSTINLEGRGGFPHVIIIILACVYRPISVSPTVA